MSTVIEAQGLSKWFGEVIAINHLDFEIGPGVTGLLGPNGAGKTTFLKVTLGLYRPSRGTIRIFGQPPCNNLSVLRRIAYCPEAHNFFDNMSGFDFVVWMNRYWGMTKTSAKKAAEKACEFVHMTDRMHDPIETYSHGMRQRINLAQALALDAELLILDEPMAGLDPESRERMFSLIQRLGEQGKTVIVSSHILHEVERVTNNVILLHMGRILATGAVREIRELIDEHPHAVTVECARPRWMAEQFISDESTLNVEFEETRFTVRTKNPNQFYQKFNDIVLAEKLQVESISCPDDNLQSVFDYLVK